MIERHLGKQLKEAALKYPVLALTGPRQSGKTTLCRKLFPDYAYVNLEKPDVRRFALEDPNDFLAQFKGPAIIDEAQRAPELFSYLMPIVDERRKAGGFILTGSQNFLLMEAISQSLAGRCAVFHLLPFSLDELLGRPPLNIKRFSLRENATKPDGFEVMGHLRKGGFPPIHDRNYEASDWLAQYTQTYLERDVRTLLNVGDLEVFERFLRLCAGRSGQILNYNSLASDCGVSLMTAKRWISVLKASFTVALLRPHHNNLGKRLIKSPKLYFYDTGLLCYLLGIRSDEELATHSARGAIFETFVISELVKSYLHQGKEPPLFYWRDSSQHEIDLLVEEGERLYPIEIKSGKTIASDMLSGLQWWSRLAKTSPGALVYGGDESFTRQGVDIRPWFSL